MNDSNESFNLEPLDPGFHDPGYWVRFHGTVLSRAQGELSRRRQAVHWSVPEVVFQWRRTLVPLTLLAAGLAGLFLVGQDDRQGQATPVALEEALVEGLPGEPIPTVLERTADLDEVAFLTEAGGFIP
jgi:hypothetical protein